MAECGVYSGKAKTSQLFLIGNLMLPPNSNNEMEASLVEVLVFFSFILHSVHVSLSYSILLQTEAH